MRVVADPNVLVSALLSAGTTAELLDRWLYRQEYQLVVCPALLAELTEVLARPKLARRIPAEVAAFLLEALRQQAESCPDPVVVPGASGDPDDDYLVALAAASGADCLVSGDPDLHVTGSPVVVRRPRELLDMLRSAD